MIRLQFPVEPYNTIGVREVRLCSQHGLPDLHGNGIGSEFGDDIRHRGWPLEGIFVTLGPSRELLERLAHSIPVSMLSQDVRLDMEI